MYIKIYRISIWYIDILYLHLFIYFFWSFVIYRSSSRINSRSSVVLWHHSSRKRHRVGAAARWLWCFCLQSLFVFAKAFASKVSVSRYWMLICLRDVYGMWNDAHIIKYKKYLQYIKYTRLYKIYKYTKYINIQNI